MSLLLTLHLVWRKGALMPFLEICGIVPQCMGGKRNAMATHVLSLEAGPSAQAWCLTVLCQGAWLMVYSPCSWESRVNSQPK